MGYDPLSLRATQTLLSKSRQSIRRWVLPIGRHLLCREPLLRDIAQTIQTASILVVNS